MCSAADYCERSMTNRSVLYNKTERVIGSTGGKIAFLCGMLIFGLIEGNFIRKSEIIKSEVAFSAGAAEASETNVMFSHLLNTFDGIQSVLSRTPPGSRPVPYGSTMFPGEYQWEGIANKVNKMHADYPFSYFMANYEEEYYGQFPAHRAPDVLSVWSSPDKTARFAIHDSVFQSSSSSIHGTVNENSVTLDVNFPAQRCARILTSAALLERTGVLMIAPDKSEWKTTLSASEATKVCNTEINSEPGKAYAPVFKFIITRPTASATAVAP